MRARFTLVYDPNAPATLVAPGLIDLASAGFLPPNDIASFFENPSPAVRAAALLSLNVKKSLPADVQRAVLDRLDDQAAEVRRAAMSAVAPLQLRAAIPRLLAVAQDSQSPDRMVAIEVLCFLRDVRALPVYLMAIQDRNPGLRRAGELALLAIRDRAANELEQAARSGSFSGPAALSLDRVRARFEPIQNGLDGRIGPASRGQLKTCFVGREKRRSISNRTMSGPRVDMSSGTRERLTRAPIGSYSTISKTGPATEGVSATTRMARPTSAHLATPKSSPTAMQPP